MNQFVSKADDYLRLKYVPAYFANVHLDDEITACPTDQTFHRIEATALVRAHAREEAFSIPTILNNLEFAAAFLCALLSVSPQLRFINAACTDNILVFLTSEDQDPRGVQRKELSL